MENPLRAGHLFNDERFLAALWRAHKNLDHTTDAQV
jgi:hypothetical protein